MEESLEYIDFRVRLNEISEKWRLRGKQNDLIAVEVAKMVMKLANPFLYVNARQFHSTISSIEVAAAVGEEPYRAAMRIATYLNTCK